MGECEMEDYTAYNEKGEEIGEIGIISKGETPTFQEMPKELEINGFIYIIQV